MLLDMIIIGEKLNSSIPNVMQAIENEDKNFVKDMALKQHNAGANYIDLNAAMFMDMECEKLVWLVQSVQETVQMRLMIDSQNPKALEAALKVDKIGGAIINSITLDEKRYNSILPLVKEYQTGIVALPIDNIGVPCTAQKRLQVADRLINNLVNNGIDIHNIYVDALAEALATDSNATKTTLETISLIRNNFPEVHIVCGLSNVSFGLPKRKYINLAFFVSAIMNGLDSAIMDITNNDLKSILFATLAISGQDEYCLEYLEYCRNDTNLQ
jgi:cobalamin-dependent methionine synthase I